MAAIRENRIVSAVAETGRQAVRLTWAGGSATVAEFGHLAGRGVFSAFLDPVFFAGVALRDGGRVLLWPGDLEFDADALWFQAHPEDNPFAANGQEPPPSVIA